MKAQSSVSAQMLRFTLLRFIGDFEGGRERGVAKPQRNNCIFACVCVHHRLC